MTGKPIGSPFWQLDQQDAEKLAAVKEDFMKMDAEVIIHRSSSPFASLLHLVKKLDRSWCPFSDFRWINGMTVPDTYPRPNMMDFSARVTGCKFLCLVNLRRLLSNFYASRRHSKDCHHHSIWPL
jgi:hypothetical protein